MGRASAAACELNSDWPDDHAAEEGTKGHGGAEEVGRAHGHAEGQDKDGEGKQIPGSGAGHIGKELGDDPLPTTRAKTTSAPSFSVVTARTCQTLSDCSVAAHDGGQKHQQKDGEEIFHHQPAEGHVARCGVQRFVVGEDAGQDDRTGDGDGHAENRPGGP